MIRLRVPSKDILQSVLAQEIGAGVTYQEVGATRGTLPTGYHHQNLSKVIGRGREVFEACSAYLDTWQLQKDSGFTVYPPESRALEGETILLALPVLGIVVVASCRVVYAVNELNRHGFAYGTLPEHAECGEEYFGVAIDSDETVHFEVHAFSKQQALLARLGGPISRRLQLRALNRYAEAIATSARSIS